MANSKSALKRMRQNNSKRLVRKYYHKSVRTAIKKLKIENDLKLINAQIPKVFSMIDKLVKKNIIHINKASRIKSKLSKKLLFVKK